jgi:tetratricopeptide (TPR) repeat protein
VTMLGNEAAKIELGGTRNPGAFDAYLRASKSLWTSKGASGIERAINDYSNAISLDSEYALAYASRALALDYLATWPSSAERLHAIVERAQADAHKAIALAPDLGEGHLALGESYEDSLEFTPAGMEYERALTLAPGSSLILRDYGAFEVLMGHGEAGLTALRRAVALDPLNSETHFQLGTGLHFLHRSAESMAAFKQTLVLNDDSPNIKGWLADEYYLEGDPQSAISLCEKTAQDDECGFALALAYNRVGQREAAETMRAKLHASFGEASGWTNESAIYAQWGNSEKALALLGTAMHHRDPGLERIRTSPFFDPLRNEPRFQAIEKALKFPD